MKRIYVKPITPNDPNTKWCVFEMSPFEDFIDDIRRAGLRVALHNLVWLLTH